MFRRFCLRLSEESALSPDWLTPTRVSYTHLDVYKRQLVDDARTVTEPVIKVSGYGLSHIHESAARLQDKYLSLIHI